MKFKVGDRVRVSAVSAQPKLVMGDIHTVVATEADRIYLKGRDFAYRATTFELVEPAKPAFRDAVEEEIDRMTEDAVRHPAHYGGDTTYEVIKVAEAWELDKDAYLFNVLKYVGRAGKKGSAKELEDLEKAAFYLGRKITNLKGGK